jgi:hypothetical protein
MISAKCRVKRILQLRRSEQVLNPQCSFAIIESIQFKPCSSNVVFSLRLLANANRATSTVASNCRKTGEQREIHLNVLQQYFSVNPGLALFILILQYFALSIPANMITIPNEKDSQIQGLSQQTP